MATTFKRDTMSNDILQHFDNGSRNAMILKATPSATAISYTGDVPFWQINLYDLEPTDQKDPSGEPLLLCEMEKSRIKLSKLAAPQAYTLRNMGSDQVHFVHRGEALLVTEVGEIEMPVGRFVFITRGVGYRIIPKTDDYLSLIFESEEYVKPNQVNFDAIELEFIYPTFPYIAYESNEETEWEERLVAPTWTATAQRSFDPVLTKKIVGDNNLPVYAFDADDVPAHSARVPNPGRPFVMFINDLFHWEYAKRSDPLPMYHRNIRANEIQFVHVGSGDRDTELGFREAPIGTFNNYPAGIEHSVANRTPPCECMIWECRGAVSVNPDLKIHLKY